MRPQHLVENVTSTEIDLDRLAEVVHVCADVEGIEQLIELRLTNNPEIRALNLRYRNIDLPTDVLTFPSGQSHPFPKGAVAISIDYALAQAEARGVSLDEELIALTVHGVLHLAGYDDETPDDKQLMQTRMNEIGQILGTPIDAEWTSVLHQESE